MRYFLLLILTLLTFDAFPQRKVSGVIFDTSGRILPDADIREDETNNRTYSDMDGVFHITTTNDTCSLSFSFIGFATKTVKIVQDTTINIVLGYDWYDTRWLSIGAKYDVVNSMFGITFSNGYDEMPLIHFESFSDRVIYKMNVQTNFNKDYLLGVNLGWKYPFRRLSLLSIGYQHYHQPSKDFFHHDVHISAETFLKNTALMVRIGYQTLNDHNNWGASVRFQNSIVYSKLLVGLSAGYYFNYFTYSLYFQGLFTSKNISFRLAYDKMDTYAFFNIGLSYFFYR